VSVSADIGTVRVSVKPHRQSSGRSPVVGYPSWLR